MRIVLDLEGGDKPPIEYIKGAAEAIRARNGLSVLLVGAGRNKDAIEQCVRTQRAEICKHMSTAYAAEVAPMDIGTEKDINAWARKRTTTIYAAVKAVADGEGDAVVAACNTGVLGTAAGAKFGRKGKRRPCLTDIIPTPGGTVLVGDVGFDKEPQPDYLPDFAQNILELAPFLIGARDAYNIVTINTALEREKGMPFAIEGATALEKAGFPWKSHAEPRHVLTGEVPFGEPNENGVMPSIPVHIALAGGTWGNIMLKTIEATSDLQKWSIKEAIGERFWIDPRRWIESLAGLILKYGPGKRAKKNMQSKMGAAVVAGLNKFAMKMHGSADAEDVQHAVLVAADVASAANGHGKK